MKVEDIRPIGSRIFIKIRPLENITKTGLIVIDKDNKESNQATVINSGDVDKVSAGDVIIFEPYGLVYINTDDSENKYAVIDIKYVQAVLENV